MPRIFDNIEFDLLPELRSTLAVVRHQPMTSSFLTRGLSRLIPQQRRGFAPGRRAPPVSLQYTVDLGLGDKR